MISAFHYGIYAGLGLTLLSLGLWRIASGGSPKPAVVIGATILTIIAFSLLGILSLQGIEKCLNEKGGGRSKLLICG